jgi:phospholipid/cholesterol/gamma-HCH transport system substrate-binding protein
MPTSATRQAVTRLVAIVALALAALAVVIVLASGGSRYVVHAQFADAGQLVSGDLVDVAGHQVGTIGPITLTDDGLADVELDISDHSITPLHEGTVAEVRQLSLSGVANRFIGLTLGPSSAPVIHNHTLGGTQTKGIVDLDVFLDSLTPNVRHSLQRLIRTGAYLLQPASAAQANQAFRYLNPALSQSTALGREVVADKFALDRLVASAAQLSSALAARSGDLGGAVTNTAAALREVASQRTALGDTIARAPAVLSQGTAVLRHVDSALGVLNPVLTDLQPVAPRLAGLLVKLVPVARDAIPTIAGVQALLPGARAALLGLPPVERKATPAVESLTAAIGPITPILAGLRPYTPDVVAGFFNAFGGSTGGYYDANGHYFRVGSVLAGGGTSLTGVLGLLGGLTGSPPQLNGARSGQLARCPGGAVPPATAGGNPWLGPDLLPGTGNVCNPANNQK